MHVKPSMAAPNHLCNSLHAYLALPASPSPPFQTTGLICATEPDEILVRYAKAQLSLGCIFTLTGKLRIAQVGLALTLCEDRKRKLFKAAYVPRIPYCLNTIIPQSQLLVQCPKSVTR